MIRKYKEEEIPALMKIWENATAIAHPFLSKEFSSLVKQMMTDKYLPDSDTWIYKESDNIVGFISMMDNEIGGLFVDPSYQSKGIGTSLVDHMAQYHDGLEVEVFKENKIGRPFYEKNGFTIINEYYMEGANQEVLRMKRP